jgi:tetratricopeptide (TPR) repeat protein
MKSINTLVCLSAIFSSLLIVQSCHTGAIPTPKTIKLYIYENDNKQIELNGQLLVEREPTFVLNRESIHKARLIQRGVGRFTLEIEVSEDVSSEIQRITSANIGKRLIFFADTRVLSAPLIFDAIRQGRFVIELSPLTKAEAENIAGYFASPVEFLDTRPFRDQEFDPTLKKAYELREKGEHDKAIEAFEQVIKHTPNYDTKFAIYNEIALCYRLKRDEESAAKTYRKLVSDPVRIDLNNYMIIAQSYFYLSQFETRRQKIIISEDLFNKGIATLEYIIKNFPTTRSADWASLTIGTYELSRGNIKEAQKRAILAIQGDFGGQGYLLLGLCYEYQRKFGEAREEYQRLVENLPDAEETRVAHEFIKNLDANKPNIEKMLSILLVPGI